jgi:hypothetical protein
MTRQFSLTPAKRARVPLLIGLIGPSGSGKTYSALRLGAGMVKVLGGKLACIDTEADRALHYAPSPGTVANPAAGTFDFEHLPLAPPFGPADYLAALEHCKNAGASVVIVDSMSHEHEGEGGVLDMHDAEVERIGKADGRAWIAPKAERRKLINGLLQLGLSAIFCFRAQEKLDWKKKGADGQLQDLGWQPIAGAAFVYEMTARALLLPGADGVPTWEPEIAAERSLVKRPTQFRALFERTRGQSLSEEIGEEMARWAKGDAPAKKTTLAESLAACTDVDAWTADMIAELNALSPTARKRADAAAEKRRKELAT